MRRKRGRVLIIEEEMINVEQHIQIYSKITFIPSIFLIYNENQGQQCTIS